MEAGTHGPRGNRCIRSALRKLAAIHASTPLDRILVTGDITDAGTRAEWAEFIDLLRGFPELRARLSFVPGNHDMNIVDRTNPGRLDLPVERGPVAPQAPRRPCPRCDPGRSRPRGRPRVRRARTIAHRTTCGKASAPSCCARWRTRHAARTMGDGEGLGRDLPAGRTPHPGRWIRAHPPQFECPQPLLAHQCDRRRQSVAAQRAQVDPARFSPSRLDDLAPSSGRGVSGGFDQSRATASVSRSSMRRTFWRRSRPMPRVSSSSTAIGTGIGSGPAAMSFCAPRRRRRWVLPREEKYRGSFHVHELAFGADGGIRLTTTERVKVS